jgi:hypothetical protein
MQSSSSPNLQGTGSDANMLESELSMGGEVRALDLASWLAIVGNQSQFGS